MSDTHDLHHSLPYDRDDQPALSEYLQVQFNALLRGTAEKLETFSVPDKLTFITKNAAFGNFGDGSLTITHTIHDGANHTGSILFRHPDDAERSFYVHNDKGYATLWATNTGRRYKGRKVLQLLERNWPMSDDDTQSRNTRDKLAAPTDEPSAEQSDTPAQDILDLIETFTLRTNTGTLEHRQQWAHYDAPASTPYEMLLLTVVSNADDSLREISADFLIDYFVGDASVELRCHMHADQIGNVTFGAYYRHPETKQPEIVTLSDELAEIVTPDRLESFLAKMVDEKWLSF